MIVRFVDIGEIGDHHCLTFVFISRLKVDNQNAKSPLVDTTKTSSRSTNTKNQQHVGDHKKNIPSADKNHTFRYTDEVTNIMEITSW